LELFELGNYLYEEITQKENT